MVSISKGFLDECEREPLHLSGKIQSFGALLGFDGHGKLSHWSSNLETIIGVGATDAVVGQIRPHILALADGPDTRLYLEHGLDIEGRSWDVSLSRQQSGDAVIAELMPALELEEPLPEPPGALNQVITTSSELEQARREMVEWVARCTGFDRVMYYQFLSNGDGEVLEEITTERAPGSYFGLRFPASDIPAIARQIYLKNPWRSISDAGADSVDLLGDGELDLTRVDLRSVSPVHQVYMNNMGDSASFTLPVELGGELDALVACHHATPRVLPLEVKRAVADGVRRYNLLMRDYHARERVRLVDEFGYQLRRLFSEVALMREAERGRGIAEGLMRIFQADAMVVCSEEALLVHGAAVDEGVIDALDERFTALSGELTLITDHLTDFIHGPLLTEMAGAAGLRLPNASGQEIRLYLFRGELVQRVLWGGNPDKPVEYHDGELGIAPRNSFSKWVEERLGYCAPWERETRLKLLRLRDESRKASAFLFEGFLA